MLPIKCALLKLKKERYNATFLKHKVKLAHLNKFEKQQNILEQMKQLIS